MVFLGTIIGFIVSKEGKIMDLKKIEALVNMLVLSTPPKDSSLQWDGLFYRCFIEKIASIMSLITKLLKKSKVFEWTLKCQNVGRRLRTGMYKPLF
jgi:hypothetical protein